MWWRRRVGGGGGGAGGGGRRSRKGGGGGGPLGFGGQSPCWPRGRTGPQCWWWRLQEGPVRVEFGGGQQPGQPGQPGPSGPPGPPGPSLLALAGWRAGGRWAPRGAKSRNSAGTYPVPNWPAGPPGASVLSPAAPGSVAAAAAAAPGDAPPTSRRLLWAPVRAAVGSAPPLAAPCRYGTSAVRCTACARPRQAAIGRQWRPFFVFSASSPPPVVLCSVLRLSPSPLSPLPSPPLCSRLLDLASSPPPPRAAPSSRVPRGWPPGKDPGRGSWIVRHGAACCVLCAVSSLGTRRMTGKQQAAQAWLRTRRRPRNSSVKGEKNEAETSAARVIVRASPSRPASWMGRMPWRLPCTLSPRSFSDGAPEAMHTSSPPPPPPPPPPKRDGMAWHGSPWHNPLGPLTARCAL